MKLLSFRLILFGVFLTVFVHGSEPAAPVSVDLRQRAFSKLTGVELAQRLPDGARGPRAYYELWRRAHPGRDAGFEDFMEFREKFRVVTCPQGKAQPPIYLVLYGLLNTPISDDHEYKVTNREELFPRGDRFRTWSTRNNEVIEAFDSEGREITPFGGNNVLDGILSDVNGDGLIERVETTRYGIKGVEAVEVLEITTVKSVGVPVFSLLLNWGADEWTFRLTDSATPGIADIEVGPRTREGMITKAVFRWDKTKGVYIGPTGDHFRVLDNARPFEQLEAFAAAKLEFPKDGDTFEKNAIGRATLSEKKATGALSKPYQSRSLASLSDAELLRYMGAGRSEYELEREAEVKNSLPENFWNLSAKEGALAVVAMNRQDEHKKRFRLALEDRDKSAPPERCSIAFSDSSALCYNDVGSHYYLHVDPADSYLAYASTWSGGSVFYNVVHDQPAFDLRICPLRYDDARKVADVIWWLDRVRSQDTRDDASFGRSFSTADGSGTLIVRSATGEVVFEREGTLWSADLGERWNSNYNHEACLNFACYLLTDVLPKRLGQEWTRWKPKYDRNILARREGAPRYTEEEMEHCRILTGRMLELFSTRQEKLSYALVSVAARAAGTFSMEGKEGRLEAIETALPAPAIPLRSFDEVMAEMKSTSHGENRVSRIEETKKQEALQTELKAVMADRSENGAGNLREIAALARRQIATAKDPVALYAWAVSDGTGSQWALQRLAQLDRVCYEDALEVEMKGTKGKWVRQYFEELAKLDPDRAVRFVSTLSSTQARDLEVSSFLLLWKCNNIPDDSSRLSAIIELLHDPQVGWEERLRAIELLVPLEEPLRYPGKEIDAALLELLEPGQADKTINFTLGEACFALGRRGRVDQFGRITAAMSAVKDPEIFQRMAGSLTLLTQSNAVGLADRLAEVLGPHLQQTNMNVTEVMWNIWAADLRRLKPELELLATSGVDDYEDKKANTWGGSVTPVAGRFHLARKIVSLWNEEDAFTRVRLLVGLMANESYSFAGEQNPQRIERMRRELTKAGAALSSAEKERMTAFLRNLELSKPGDDRDSGARQRAVAFARTSLGL